MTSRERVGGALLLRFALAGGFNSAFHAGVVALLSLVVRPTDGWIAILIAWLVSLPVGYLTQAIFVWRRRLSWMGFLRLALSQGPAIAVSTLAGGLLGSLGAPLPLQELVALVVGAAISFLLQRYWVFAPAREEPGASENG